jgi:putative ABC transport system permease protein
MNIQNVLIVRAPVYTQWDSTFIERVENYKHELSQIDGILSVATSSRLPGDRLGRAFEFRLSDQPSSSHYTISHLGVDYNFFDTYRISIITGRKFLATDHNADYSKISSAIVNQNAVNLLGIETATEAIGKEVVLGDNRWRIIGVVNDFHQESLKKPMEPIIFIPTYSTYGPTSIRYQKADTETVISDVEKVYKKFFPNNAFSYFFMEDTYKRQYNDEKRFAKVITIFTVLGIIISCLGLIGLSSYTAVQRTKEIGIRKALGASLASIVTLLSAGFIKLVLAAIILALPIAYYYLDNWLTNYPYRISLQWFLFVIPALLILFITFLTISFQIIKTARINPANTLKYE